MRWAWSLAAAGAVAALAVALLVDLPDPFPYVRDATTALGRWAYVLVAAVVLLETSVGLGMLSPGEAVLAVAGAAATGDGALDLPVLLAVVWGFGVAGDTTSYLIARRHGPRVLRGLFVRLGLTPARLDRVGALYAGRGGWVLVGGRFVAPVRDLAPFVAGSSGMALGSSCASTSSASCCEARPACCRPGSAQPSTRVGDRLRTLNDLRSPPLTCNDDELIMNA